MLETIKKLLGITGTAKDDLLNTLIELNSTKLLTRIGNDTIPVPFSLEFIVIELTIERYNRLGSEGLTSESIEGISYTYADSSELLKPYEGYIKQYLNAANGKFRFL